MWQPIETAPRDGTTVDLWLQYDYRGEIRGHRITDCAWKQHDRAIPRPWIKGSEIDPPMNWWSKDRFDYPQGEPTHWMPPPAPPR